MRVCFLTKTVNQFAKQTSQREKSGLALTRIFFFPPLIFLLPKHEFFVIFILNARLRLAWFSLPVAGRGRPARIATRSVTGGPLSPAKIWPHRLVVRTRGSQPRNRGSIPRGATKIKLSDFCERFCRAADKAAQCFCGFSGSFRHSADTVRHTAQTLAIFANRRRKNRKIFGKFFDGMFILRSSNFFPKFCFGDGAEKRWRRNSFLFFFFIFGRPDPSSPIRGRQVGTPILIEIWKTFVFDV